jgi:hypothetical protein
MATWKKVVVSGSAISQLQNDAGYLTSVTAQNSFVTMSVNGVNILADSAVDTLTFASSSGAGLNIVGDAGADSITFTLGSIPNASLSNSAVTVTAGSGLTGGGSISLGSSATVNVGAGSHITVNTDDIAVNTTTLTPAISGSIFTQVSGDIAITAGGVATIAANSVALGTDTTGDYVANVTSGAGLTGGTTGEGSTPTLAVGAGSHITVNPDDVAVNTTTLTPAISGSILTNISGDITVTAGGVASIGTGVIVNADINNSAAIAASKINFAGTSIVSGSSIASGAQGEVTLTTNGVAGSTVDLGLQTTDSPQFVGLTLTGDAAVNGGDITTSATTFNLVNANATTVNFAGAATTLNLGNASGTTTIAGNAVVQGDFTVNGTTTYLNVTDLYVEDKFIVLASGSATAGDGGIIIDRGSDTAGNMALGYDSITDRWGFQTGLTDSTNTFDPTSASGVSGSFVPYLFTEANHGATKPITGEFAVQGAMYTSTAGDIWIYA